MVDLTQMYNIGEKPQLSVATKKFAEEDDCQDGQTI